MALYSEIRDCRLCGGNDLVDVFGFGRQYLASTFVKSNNDHPLAKVQVPLTVALCGNCGLVQLKETVERSELFHDYFYRSSTNPLMREALRDVARDLSRKAELKKGDYVLDIGCNDCTMLGFFTPELVRVGVEPARNIDWGRVNGSIRIVNNYFSRDIALEASRGALYKAVASVAMLYSVEDVNAFAAQTKGLLAPDGVWCIQVSYLPDILKNLSFYDICHEHLYYFSLSTISELLERNGFEVFDASTNDVNGGSLRIFAAHGDRRRAKTAKLRELMEVEKDLQLMRPATYARFFDAVQRLRDTVRGYIQKERERGGLVLGLGASTKGNVLLQFFGLDREWIPYISERNPEKVSLRTLGTNIELVSEEKARAARPSCMLVLIWFFKEEILARERAYLEQGGSLLFPMPYCHVVTGEGERAL